MTALLLSVLLVPDSSATIRGQYVEARTCDVYTGACFSNADTGLAGKNAVLAWKIDSGSVEGVKLDGLGVVAVLSTPETLGLKQSGPGKAIILVDDRASKTQHDALVAFVKSQAGKLVGEVVAVRTTTFDLEICKCDGASCATLTAGPAKIKTRCINPHHDKACGNEDTQYPPLAKGVKANAAVAVEHSFSGKGLNVTWSDGGRRGAFVGSFATR